jgi:hypothetical protein
MQRLASAMAPAAMPNVLSFSVVCTACNSTAPSTCDTHACIAHTVDTFTQLPLSRSASGTPLNECIILVTYSSFVVQVSFRREDALENAQRNGTPVYARVHLHLHSSAKRHAFRTWTYM